MAGPATPPGPSEYPDEWAAYTAWKLDRYLAMLARGNGVHPVSITPPAPRQPDRECRPGWCNAGPAFGEPYWRPNGHACRAVYPWNFPAPNGWTPEGDGEYRENADAIAAYLAQG